MVRAICARVDALPLAVELAAARTPVFAPAELLERLDRRLAVLTEGPVDAPDRQVTLRATIEWSYELLDPEEAAHFARLSVFAGSFDSAAALAVCATGLGGLESLLEQSLLARTQSGRFFMLETIRELPPSGSAMIRSFGCVTPSTTSRSHALPGSPTTRRERCATT